MTDAETISKLQAELLRSKKDEETLKKKVEGLEAPELNEEDQKVLLAIAHAEDGLRHSQIEKLTEFSSLRVSFHLARLQRRNFILLQTKDLKPSRIHLDGPGLNWLAQKNLI